MLGQTLRQPVDPAPGRDTRRRCYAHAIAPPGLGGIEGLIRTLEPGIEVVTVAKSRHAEAGGDLTDLSEGGVLDPSAQFFRHLLGFCRPAMWQHDDEFLAPQRASTSMARNWSLTRRVSSMSTWSPAK